MDQNTKADHSSYGVKNPEEKSQDISLEAELWSKVEGDPENPDHHKNYAGHIIRSGLLKEGSRRYGPMIEDSEKYSVETRRLARYYQKQIVNLIFMAAPGPGTKKKNPSLGYILAFLSMMVFMTGIFDLNFWYLIPIGLGYLIPYIIVKYQQSRKNTDKSHDRPQTF